MRGVKGEGRRAIQRERGGVNNTVCVCVCEVIPLEVIMLLLSPQYMLTNKNCSTRNEESPFGFLVKIIQEGPNMVQA